MYRFFLFCVMSAVVFGDNDEAKYIDLLPEAEKQEFLNRIARRIIEEIQAKDVPEQPHAEVSDDQLNAHHTYVQDIIKEESESLRNERRNYDTKENEETKPENDNFETQKIFADKNPAMRENSQHIDLTLRNDRHDEENDRKSTDDSKFSVIPVKVIYEDNINGTQSPTNVINIDSEQNVQMNTENLHLNNSKTKVLNESSTRLISEEKVIHAGNINGTQSPTNLLNIDSEQNVQMNTENLHLNNAKTKVLNESPTGLISEEKENVNQTNVKLVHSTSLVSDNQPEILSKNDIKNFTNDKLNLHHNLEGNSTETQFSTDANLLPSSSKANKYDDDSFENSGSSTSNIYITSNRIATSEGNFPTEANNPLNKANTNPSPLTLATTQSKLKDPIEIESQFSRVYVTTDKSAGENQIIKSNIGHDIHTAESAKEIEVKSVKNSVGKEFLRTRLEIQLEDNEFEEGASIERENEPIQRKNNNIKQYYVYEVPKEKTIFSKVADTKEKEQPYVVPIYNFEPRNAYYNAYNHFGINNDEEEKSIHDKESILDEELNLRSGFNIDLTPKHNVKDEKTQLKHLIKYPRHSQVKYILNSKFEYDPDFIDYRNNENFKPIIKRDNNFKEISWYNDKIGKLSQPPRNKYIPLRHEPYLDGRLIQRPSKIPSMIKYIPLRKRPPTIPSKIKYIPFQKRNEIRKGTSRRKYKRIYSRDKLRMPDSRNGWNAGKTYLYEKKKFGYMQPRKKPKWSNPLRMRDGSFDIELNKNNEKSNNIDFDYYYGRYAEDEPSEVTDEETVYDFTNKLGKEHYRAEGYDCGDDCVQMSLEKPREISDKYFENLLRVLKDMIYRDNRDLVNYSWLRSTVDLESALKKLIDLIETIENGENLHRLDLELLNYILNLYNTSRNQLKNTVRPTEQSNALPGINDILNYFLKMVRRRISLPKNRNRRPDSMNNAIQIWNRYYIRDGLTVDKWIENAETLSSFKIFLNDLEDEMFDLHNALKHISLITTYDNQNWYNDLKNIYLKPASKKQLFQVILHLAASRLFSSIEDTAKDAEEDKSYINNNGKKVRRIQEEFVFVLRILEAIKKTNH